MKGALTVTNSIGFVVVGGPGDDGCAGNTVAGNTSIRNNTGGVEMAANQLGPLQFTNNAGAGAFPEDSMPSIEGNTVHGSLLCSANTPGLTNDGLPNSVTGARGGQCTGSF